jgi:hypothetical protein
MNPVHHGLCATPQAWQFSSIHRLIAQNVYAPDWGEWIDLLGGVLRGANAPYKSGDRTVIEWGDRETSGRDKQYEWVRDWIRCDRSHVCEVQLYRMKLM